MPDAPSTARILVVDDDPGVVRLVGKRLKAEGFTTATAGSGEAAMAWLAAERADLMLLDLKLPDMDGKELITHLESKGCSIPFVIITGQGDERAAVEMMKRGAHDYLVKDVQFIEFVPTVVRRALDQLRRDKRLIEAQTALRESREQLLAISEREQARFGAELHDGLGQQLTAIELRCQAIKEDLPPDRPDLSAQISEVGRFLREAITQTRSLARGLSPVHPGSGGLAEALEELAGRMSKGGRIRCVFESSKPKSDEAEGGNVRAAGHLFRIAQEAVNNAVKHSGASQVLVRLVREDGLMRLEISDNGRGIPNSMGPSQGIGLQIMRQRASVIGAELELRSRTGSGTTVRCELRTEP